MTPKQFGDACEMLVCAELTLGGYPAQIMNDGWPGYDLVAETSDGLKRISVKGMRVYDKPQSGRFWYFKSEGLDWLALVRIKFDGSRQFFLLPHNKAVALSKPASDGQRRLDFSIPSLKTYENNFVLGLGGIGGSTLPPPPAENEIT